MTPTSPVSIPDRGTIRFEEPRTGRGIARTALALTREAAGPLVRGYLAIAAPVALAAGLATTLFVRAAAPVLLAETPAAPEDVPPDVSTTYAGAMLLSFLATATVVALVAAVVRRYREGVPPREMTVGALWDEARGLLIPALSMVLVVGGALALLSLLIGAGGGGLLTLAAMVWVMPYAAVAIAVRMLEGGTLGSSFARARALVAGRWGRTAGGLLIALLVAALASLVLTMPLALAAAAQAGAPPSSPVEAVLAIGWVLGPAQVLSSGVLMVPILAAFAAHGALVASHAPEPSPEADA